MLKIDYLFLLMYIMYRFVYESMIDNWIEILQYLSILDIVKISLVSKLFNKINKSELIWKRLCYLHPNFHLFKITKSWYETYSLNYTGTIIEIVDETDIVFKLKGNGKIDFYRYKAPLKSLDLKIKFINIVKYREAIILISKDNILYRAKYHSPNHIDIVEVFESGKQFLGKKVLYSIYNTAICVRVGSAKFQYLYIERGEIIMSCLNNIVGYDTIIDAWEVDGILYINYGDNKIITTNRYA